MEQSKNDEKRICMGQAEFCQAVGISTPTFYRWVKADGFPVFRSGRKYLVPVDEFKRWISERRGKDILGDGADS